MVQRAEELRAKRKKVSGGGSNLAACWDELKCVPVEIRKGVRVFIPSHLGAEGSV